MSRSQPMSDFARRALDATTSDELRRDMLATIRPLVGFDFGVIWSPGDPVGTVEGFDRAVFTRYHRRQRLYADDVERLIAAAEAQHDVTRDEVALDLAQRSRSRFYSEIIRPVGSASFLTAVMRLGQHVVGIMQLGRGRGFRFPERAAASLRQLVPTLALAEAAHAPRSRARRHPQLTTREAELVGYLQLGFTNREIAVACGTSPNTVRNQLAALFRKAEVSTRAELVAWVLGAI